MALSDQATSFQTYASKPSAILSDGALRSGR
jgi:hypothetical protein